MLLTTKPTKGESIYHLYGKLKEISENCESGNPKDSVMKDLFIADEQDSKTHRELLKETVYFGQALRLAINIKLGHRNDLQIWVANSHLKRIPFYHNVNCATRIFDPTSNHNLNPQINCAVTVASLSLSPIVKV